jgi:hypothetical protein
VCVPLAVALDIEFTDPAIEIAGLRPRLHVFTPPPRGFCPCELVSENNRAACLRGLWMSRLPRQPRARARRRQRHRGSSARASPGDDGDGDGPSSRRSRNQLPHIPHAGAASS